MKYIIYCYCNKTNLKKYIGITKRDFKKRELNHISEAYNPNSLKYNTPFKCAIRKYGIENFDSVILDFAQDLDEANQKEKYYIKKYNTYCYAKNGWGYNATKGGDGVSKPCINILQLNKENGDLINIFESISCAEKELNISHISECLNKKIPSAGGYCWMNEKEYYSMTKQQIFDYIQIINNRIVQLTKENQLIKIWNSALEASIYLNCQDSLIISVCKGKRKSHNGFRWLFYYDYINNINPIYKKKKILQYDTNKNLIEIFNTLKEAGEKNNIIPQVLGRHVNTNKEYLGFYWYRNEVIL